MRPPGLTSWEGTPARATGSHLLSRVEGEIQGVAVVRLMYEPLPALCWGRGQVKYKGREACVTIISQLD